MIVTMVHQDVTQTTLPLQFTFLCQKTEIDDGEASIFKLNFLIFSFQSDTNNKVVH